MYFSGDAREYHYWDFKTELKQESTKAENWGTMIQQLVESLRGDVLDIVVKIGVPKLMNPDKTGLTELRGAVRDHVFPVMREEVKSLYAEGQKRGSHKDNVLCRQLDEPMRNYIERRERWYKLLISMDATMKFSDELLGELLLLSLIHI